MRKLFLIGEEKRKGRSEANTKLETTCVFYFTRVYQKNSLFSNNTITEGPRIPSVIQIAQFQYSAVNFLVSWYSIL